MNAETLPSHLRNHRLQFIMKVFPSIVWAILLCLPLWSM
jgi:hypothetical protein